MTEEQSAPHQHPHPHHNRIAATLKALVRTRVTAGLLVVLPIYVTWLLLTVVFSLMRDASRWVTLLIIENEWYQKTFWTLTIEGKQPPYEVEEILAQYPALKWGIDIFSVLLTILFLYSIGLFTANIIGRRLVELFENILDRVPFVKTVYRASKQILESLAGKDTQSFQRVALIPFPQERMRCVGFVTSIFRDSLTDEELATVFIPTTPNPTTGYLQILRRAELVELNWTMEEAMRTIMSGGILKPDFLTIVQNKYREELAAGRHASSPPAHLSAPGAAPTPTPHPPDPSAPR